MKNRVENINCTFLNCSPLFNHPSIVTRSQGYYQDQFVMFAVLESAKPSGGERINCCVLKMWQCDQREWYYISSAVLLLTYPYVFRLESCKIEGFLYGYWTIFFIIRYVAVYEVILSKKDNRGEFFFKENSVFFTLFQSKLLSQVKCPGTILEKVKKMRHEFHS